MHPWESRYGSRPRLRVYTPQPKLIEDSLHCWTLEFCWPLDQVISVFRPPKLLEKYVSKVHDLKLDRDCDHCLYMTEPQRLDVSDLYTCMDLTHTMYYDQFEKFAIYRRDRHHLIKLIDIEQRPKTGVIFMDCWEFNTDRPYQFDWDYSPPDGFYHRMIKNLWQYNLQSFVFTSSDFAPQPVATTLKYWTQSPWATSIDSMEQFISHVKKTNIKHWILVGGHWGFCTHDKNLGFNNLKKLKMQDPSLRFFSIPDSTAKFVKNDGDNSILTVCSEKDYVNDSLKWNYKGKIAELLI